MNSSEDFRQGRIGSLELNSRVGPNLLRGLLVAVLIHGGVIATPTILREFFGIWTIEEVEVLPKEEKPPVDIVDFFPPSNRPEPPQPPAPQIDPPKHAMPVIVDQLAPEDTFMMPEANEPVSPMRPDNGAESDTGTGTSSGGGLVDFRGDEIPSPEVYVAREIEPKPLDTNAQPDYPDMAKRARMNGTVHVQIFVDRKGSVRDYRVVKVNPKDLGFDDEVLKVVPRWKFTPALQGDHPVGVWVVIPVKFEIK